jgi:hypothetical protein
MKYILPILAILLLTSQTVDREYNTKPSRIKFLPAENSYASLAWFQSDGEIHFDIKATDTTNAVIFNVDPNGVFKNGKGDTLAVSCELSNNLLSLLQNHIVFRNTMVDSAYEYKAEVQYYRKWFKRNDTPNPLAPRSKFKNN